MNVYINDEHFILDMLQKPVQKNSKRKLKVIMLGGYPVDENMPKGGIESATLRLSIEIVNRSNISLSKKDRKKDVIKINNKYEISVSYNKGDLK